MLPKYLKYSTCFSCFRSIIIIMEIVVLNMLLILFFDNHFHSIIFQIQLVFQPCPLAPFFPS
jgi:hypothetical protein